jgi:hypothetical protein
MQWDDLILYSRTKELEKCTYTCDSGVDVLQDMFVCFLLQERVGCYADDDFSVCDPCAE